jgi:hypothetical protein
MLRQPGESAPGSSPEVLGEVTSRNGYAGLISIFRARFDELGITGETADYLGGLAAGHTTKLLTRDHMRRFGPVTLAPILGVLGIKLTATVDEEALAQISARLTPARFKRWNNAGAEMLARRRRKNPGSFKNMGHGRVARAKQILLTTPMQRSRAARHAARARWRAVREAARAKSKAKSKTAHAPHLLAKATA